MQVSVESCEPMDLVQLGWASVKVNVEAQVLPVKSYFLGKHSKTCAKIMF